MKNQEVTITNKRIQLKNTEGMLNNGIVMDVVAKPITREFCNIVGSSRGDILDIGFGLGYSANNFYSIGVKSYTCIEINKQIYEIACNWAKDKDNVTIILGDWIDIIPTLDKKFDGIFMDTYEDENYSKFEEYAKLVSKENCCLSIWEYPEFKNSELLNLKKIFFKPGLYELKLKSFHEIGWTYFVAGEFRKDKWFESKNILSKELCDEIIKENKDLVTKENAERVIDGISHKRNWNKVDLKYNSEFEEILNKTIFSSFKNIDINNIRCWFVSYDKGQLYDRHVETIKGLSLNDKEQYVTTYDFNLNDGYDGGDIEIYDIWLKNDRETYSLVRPKVGECLIYKPYQHITQKEITKNTKYQILVMVKNKELKKNLI